MSVVGLLFVSGKYVCYHIYLFYIYIALIPVLVFFFY